MSPDPTHAHALPSVGSAASSAVLMSWLPSTGGDDTGGSGLGGHDARRRSLSPISRPGLLEVLTAAEDSLTA